MLGGRSGIGGAGFRRGGAVVVAVLVVVVVGGRECGRGEVIGDVVVVAVADPIVVGLGLEVRGRGFRCLPFYILQRVLALWWKLGRRNVQLYKPDDV